MIRLIVTALVNMIFRKRFLLFLHHVNVILCIKYRFHKKIGGQTQRGAGQFCIDNQNEGNILSIKYMYQ